MGNVYTIMVDENELLDITGIKTFTVHGSRNYDMLCYLQKTKLAKDIPQFFCGYCGSYVKLTESACPCGHLRRQ